MSETKETTAPVEDSKELFYKSYELCANLRGSLEELCNDLVKSTQLTQPLKHHFLSKTFFIVRVKTRFAKAKKELEELEELVLRAMES